MTHQVINLKYIITDCNNIFQQMLDEKMDAIVVKYYYNNNHLL
jgi:hypothetical protein